MASRLPVISAEAMAPLSPGRTARMRPSLGLNYFGSLCQLVCDELLNLIIVSLQPGGEILMTVPFFILLVWLALRERRLEAREPIPAF